VAGTSGKVVLEGGSDDEGASTEAQGRAILDVLGVDKRNDVLASVYMVRSDITLPVRQVSKPGAFPPDPSLHQVCCVCTHLLPSLSGRGVAVSHSKGTPASHRAQKVPVTYRPGVF